MNLDKKAPSIERQLRNRLLLALLLVLVLCALLIQGLSRELTYNYVKSRLQHDAESLIAALVLKPGQAVQLQENRIPDVYRRAFSGHYYRIKVGDQLIESRSLWDLNLPITLYDKQTLSPHEHGVDNQLWLSLTTSITKQNQPVDIWLAEDVQPLEHDRKLFSFLILLLLFISFAALWWLQGRGLRQSFKIFEQLRLQVQSLHQGDNSLIQLTPPQEVAPLSDEIGRLITQLSQRTERSRSALGNFAHELKRPLQQLHLQLDDLPDGQKMQMTETLAQIQYLLERELKRARIAGRCLPGKAFQPEEDLQPLLKVMQRIYPHIQFDLSLSGLEANAFVPIDRDDLLELLGNLIDNAAKFAHQKVQVQVEKHHQQICFTIQDDGAGVDDSALIQLTERGTRLDESVKGHGLGLSICKSIIESYQGRLAFESNREKGLTVIACFPL
ncbi:Signal transduction histidine kinase [Oceanospirillum multiglobuliferum]|uniref:histidine kinase n=1 Tax=Oceanospirillum multiglobuliferum TaxID=64969 RepID=A0A1T4SCT9_9GAMM|nr:ATP-binding protein [Oceanospirillum multiglobuliferum]OPX55059.1 hypothetical protein BTE48_11315 [Oceanospirillum multiglobuliferum]SKA25967.1 Signal transduction histidine kinase [Oceanospirillum multiglobuliferum]